MEIAFDEFLPEALAREPKRRPWRDGDPPLPALYISHGAPRCSRIVRGSTNCPRGPTACPRLVQF